MCVTLWGAIIIIIPFLQMSHNLFLQVMAMDTHHTD